MTKELTRRRFIAALGGAAMLAGFDATTRTWIRAARAATSPFDAVPKLDGQLYQDMDTRASSAVDYGHIFHKIPAAVLRPGSVQDIVRMIQFANTHQIRVAIRSLAHTTYGQTQAEGGLVIDMRSMNSIGEPSADGLVVGPGATWGAIANAMAPCGWTPRVFPTCMGLTVGGTLNVGGMGYMSHLYGALVDHAIELDVVTGEGKLVTCSGDKESTLFNMVLGGQGQCGVIVRAKIRLVPAPTHVALQYLVYEDAERFVADQLLTAREQRFDHQLGEAGRTPEGNWAYRIEIGKHYTAPNEPDLSTFTGALGFKMATPTTQLTYRDYLYKSEPQWEAMAQANGTKPAPLLTMWIPASGLKAVLDDVFAIPPEEAGFPGVAILTMNNRRFTRPLLRVPSEEQGAGIWLLRAVPADTKEALERMLASNRALLARMNSVGGKRYAAFSMVATSQEWKEHFGADLWQRFREAKKRYDPNGILSPNPNLFEERSA
jgi:cytokinin dehydrogenase